jgi:type IV pilus assembly protein PilY1
MRFDVDVIVVVALAAALCLLGPEPPPPAEAVTDPVCPLGADPILQEGDALEEIATASDGGVVYDGSAGALRLKKAGGLFVSRRLPVPAAFNAAAAGDFDGDGWVDMVVGSSDSRFIHFYRNRTFESPEPDWSDSSASREPRFVYSGQIAAPQAAGGHVTMAAGDFDRDGKDDFVYFRNEPAGNAHSEMSHQRIYLGRGNGSFKSPYDAARDAGELGYLMWSSTAAHVVDWNRDGWPDILLGTKLGNGNDTGAVVALINDCPDPASDGVPCSASPRFEASPILTDQSFGLRGINAITFADFTGDGTGDLVVGSPSSADVRLYPGLAGGGIAPSYQTIGSLGAATVMLSADFTLDGNTDLVYGTDDFNWSHPSVGGHPGCYTQFYRNDATSEPFSGGISQLLSEHEPHGAGSCYDLDLGVVLDYDHDPDGTPDFIVADGNNAGAFFVFANRTVPTYVECGEVASGILDVGDAGDGDSVLTSARIEPDLHLPPGTSATFYLSNQDPPRWLEASPCVGDPDAYCVSFDDPIGKTLRWKAELCSNQPQHTRTPSIAGVEVSFSAVRSEIHYRGGVVVGSGIAYAGGLVQPGDQGRLFAFDAALSQTYWEAGARIDAMADSERNLYTTTASGKTRLDFSLDSEQPAKLRKALGVASNAQSAAVIEWARGRRFGLDGSSRLGSIESSTPVILSPPPTPIWYPHAPAEEKALIDGFLRDHENRPTLILFGSKSGMLHAVRSDPDDVASLHNGTEAWGFIPPWVAVAMAGDKQSGVVTTFPDGSPTVADVVIDGALRTVAIFGGGKGGRAFSALDVTETVDPETGAVLGPRPLWDVTPGGSDAGYTRSKPVLIRVRIEGVERFVAVVASGMAPEETSAPYTRGRDVLGIDVGDGSVVWRFRTACPVTSDVLAFETDDPGEAGDPEIDGFIDRVVVADRCGYVYKIDPGVAEVGDGDGDGNGGGNGGGWIGAMGSIDTGEVDGVGRAVVALFSTAATAGAIGGERPIVGTIGARDDSSGRMVLFFGTGGLASFDPRLGNGFYAVYAEDGVIRHAIVGRCGEGGCEKFYGGVVVSASQVILTRAIDPTVASSSCDSGEATTQVLDLDDFGQELSTTVAAASVSPLHGHAGAVYLTTLGGQVARIGAPVVPAPGAGAGGAFGLSLGKPMEVLGWRRRF